MGARPQPDDTYATYDIYATHPTKTCTMRTTQTSKTDQITCPRRVVNIATDIMLWIISMPFIIIIGISFLPVAIFSYILMGVIARIDKTLSNVPILREFMGQLE